MTGRIVDGPAFVWRGKVRRTWKNMLGALIGVPVVAAGVAVSAPSANAAFACTTKGLICQFAEPNFRGSVLVTPDLSTLGDTINHKDHRFANGTGSVNGVSSIINNTGNTVYLFDGHDQQGEWMQVKPRERVSGITWVKIFTPGPDGVPTKRWGSMDNTFESAHNYAWGWV